MATVLLLSSQVARGHVGNSAMQFPLQRLGVETIALPTILLSNRPDYPAKARVEITAHSLEEIIGALQANSWLDEVRAVVSGYLPSEAHVAAAARIVEKLKSINASLLYICDPVLGDDPSGIYIQEAAAKAVREQLLPLANVATPNRFELEWLTNMPVTTPEETIEAAQRLGPKIVLATSAPGDSETRLANTLVLPGEAWMATMNRRDGVPKGTGDFLTGVFAAQLVKGYSPADALALATASMDALVSASLGAQELQIVTSQEVWTDPVPWPIHELITAPPQAAPDNDDGLKMTA